MGSTTFLNFNICRFYQFMVISFNNTFSKSQHFKNKGFIQHTGSHEVELTLRHACQYKTLRCLGLEMFSLYIPTSWQNLNHELLTVLVQRLKLIFMHHSSLKKTLLKFHFLVLYNCFAMQEYFQAIITTRYTFTLNRNRAVKMYVFPKTATSVTFCQFAVLYSMQHPSAGSTTNT